MNKFMCELKSAFMFNRDRRRRFRAEHSEILHPEKRMERIVAEALSTFAMHQAAFASYKNRYSGRDVVIVAAGPTVNDYRPISGAIHIGVNTAYRCDKVDFDFIFFQDSPDHLRDMVLGINAYRPGICKKFYGIFTERVYGKGDCTCSESDAAVADAFRYRVLTGSRDRISYDISTMPLVDYGNIVFPALQFALWTNPRRIYLVGCDCSSNGHFFSSKPNWLPLDSIFRGYRDMKEFAHKWYPDTEIVSINPVGLKGFFRDEYQTGNI